MITVRKKVIMDIARVEKTLYEQRVMYNKHKHYFDNLLKDSRVLLLLSLLPAFLMGWRSGRTGRIMLLIKQLLNIAIMTLISQLKS